MEAANRLHFGALLRQFRLDAGMTQQTLAERAKLSVEAIGALERGARTRPYRETVALLARALELSPERAALLESAVSIAHPRRRRERIDALPPSLLRIVRSDTQTTSRHNLPHQMTSFVGRQHEVDEMTALLRENQLVTVVGAGGVGKTRVAVQAGSDILDDFPDGVWLVDLAPLADQTLVVSSVLSALQLPSTTGSPSDVVVAYLKKRKLLLILDNCEHVLAAACEVAASIAQSCPYVRILTTSREAFGAPGELVYRLPSMAVPPDSRRSAQEALRYGAVALFVDRAHAVNSGFALVDDNAPDVCEICRHLDGIPLAIELAAARVKVLAPRQIAQRLNQRFRLLTGGDSRALPRHQTMTALIDWSYDLLTAREQSFLESLSVFSGGCTLEAVTAVCAADGEDDVAVIDLITSLATKSLLVAELAASEQRYRLLESFRQYARDKLIARGEQDQIAQRHALVYVELAERLERASGTTPEREWFPQAHVELENWRAALEWALAKRGDVLLGQRLAAARNVIGTFGLGETRRWTREALQLVDERTPPALLARLKHAEALGARLYAEFNVSLAAATQALTLYRQLGDVVGSAYAQSVAGGVLVCLGRPTEAESLLQEALHAARNLGDRRLAANVLHHIGSARGAAGDFSGARVYLTEALQLAKVLGADRLTATAAESLAESEFLAGDAEAALGLEVDSLAMYRAMAYSPVRSIAISLALIAKYLVALGRYDEACVHAKESLEVAHAIRFDALVAESLTHLAAVTLLRFQRESCTTETAAGAARIFAFVDARCIALGVPEGRRWSPEYDRALATLRDAVGADEVTRLMAAGAMMTEDEAIDQVHALE